MGRPNRPNPSDAPRGSTARKAAHMKQETLAERTARKRAEAEQRDADHVAEGSPRSKKKRKAAQKKAG